MPENALLAMLRHTHPGDPLDNAEKATTIGLRHLARRHRVLTEEIEETTDELRALVTSVAPALLASRGVGVVTGAQLLITAGDNPHRITSEAAFAALCGTSPLPASSGQTTRHRLNRGGDRRANCAPHQIVLVRMTCDPRTKDYVTKRRAEGKSARETIRCLKRALARRLTLQDVAAHFGL
ncbi:transposase [Sanguibacter gelidistatuariae]|uniref:transposase n=1 Tax=Sanguibacter gelidistatuariae TaxID=1814289 RepID=UPI000AAB9769